MGLRDNFRQAAKELMDGPEASRPRSSSYEPPRPEPIQEEKPMYTPEPAPAPEPEPAFGMGSIDVQPPKPAEPAFGGYDPFAPSPAEPKELVTVIAPGTIIRGSVQSDSNMELYGEVQGDIITTKDLKLKGKIQGNATGGNVELYNIHMVGNVTASGTAMLDADSEVEGDVIADTLILNGKIKGNVQVTNRLALEGKAIICGRVCADRLAVDEGAVIQGEIIIGKSLLPPKPAAPARTAPPQAARPVVPPTAPAAPRPAPVRPAVPKAPAAPAAKPVLPKSPAAPKAPAPAKPEEEKAED